MIGVEESLPAMKEAGFPPAPWVGQMFSSGHPTFYTYENGSKIAVYNPGLGTYQPIERPASSISLKALKSTGCLIKRNPSASLVDIGDGALCLELHGKLNILDEDILSMLNDGLNRLENDFEGMVVYTDADNFGAGANIFVAVMSAQNEMWDQLDQSLKIGQDLYMRMRYFPKPVVTAPVGLALGGAAEMNMHAARIVAGAELYMGLVEIGVGIIPSWGGTKEMVRRVLNPPMQTKNAEALPYLQRIFEQIGLAKVATSAEEARQMGFLTQCDRVIMNRDHLLAEAKREVLQMAKKGYVPPVPEKVYAAGRDALAALRVGIYMMKEGKYITEYESHIANKLANVMTGGELSSPTWVDEQYLLDLEREATLSLMGEKKTQERMWYMLQNNKPLRN
jgi:3-hydroxyacyl-CoA dehydrogenase